MTRAIAGILALALTWMAGAAVAAPAGLFEEGAPALHLTLTAPFPALVKTARTHMDFYPATLTVSQDGGPPQTLSLQIRARGLTRRTGDLCQFPPLSLNFGKTKLGGTPFAGQRKLKLVTYCRPREDYQQKIVLESLAYRLYNVITPLSFRIRHAEVTYRQSEADPGLTRFGFLIEDIDDVAARNGREVLEIASKQVRPAQLDPVATARAGLFELMIGNLDWDFLAQVPGMECCHNARLLAAPGATAATARDVVPVPYDYDWSGLVDAPYAGPPPGAPIERITDRFYHGYCVSNPQMPQVITEFSARRAALLAVIADEPRLTPASTDKATRFLSGFFEMLDNPARVDREILKRCR